MHGERTRPQALGVAASRQVDPDPEPTGGRRTCTTLPAEIRTAASSAKNRAGTSHDSILHSGPGLSHTRKFRPCVDLGAMGFPDRGKTKKIKTLLTSPVTDRSELPMAFL